MKLSICVPTYNHERYISQMLDGALMQKTSFPFEVVIGDDASTDKTADIIRAYSARYPGRIRAFLHSENQGPASPREFAGRNNVLGLVNACQGEYVAMCEGDDYWTDPLKLQKQVDFLDQNPEFSVCHHNAEVIYEDCSTGHLFNQEDQPLESSIEDVLEDKWFMATASWVYRNYFRTTPFAHWHAHAAAGDWALLIQIAARGKIGYLPETMGIYRKHSAGLSNLHAHTNKWFLKNRMEMFKNVNAWLDYRYEKTIERTVAWYEEQLSKLENNGD